MTKKQPLPAAPGEAAAIARDLVDTIAAISTPAPGSPGASSPSNRVSGGMSPRWSPDFSGPRSILENGARFVSPLLPADAPLRSAKALVLRALRIITRDQTVFNSAVLEALRGTLLTAEAVLRDHAAGEAAAREAVGHEVVQTQRRVDALEKDRDERVESLRKSFDVVRHELAAAREGAALEQGRLRARLDVLGARTAEIAAEERELGARVEAFEKAVSAGNAAVEELRGELSREVAAREREGRAREALGHEVVETQRRAGALESGAAELRGELAREAAAREREGGAREALGLEVVGAFKGIAAVESAANALHRGVMADIAAMREELIREAGAREREGLAREALGREVVDAQNRLQAVEAKAGDREALGRDLVHTQKRLDVLERRRESSSTLDEAEVREDLRALKLEWTALREGLRASKAPPAKGRTKEAVPSTKGIPAAGDPLRAGLYADFERAFRGSEEEIRERQRADVARFGKTMKPVVDLGCGRGEFLQLLQEAGLNGEGCDANPVMVARAREKGLKVDAADLFEWLRAKPDGSLGGVTAYQVVEHLQPAALFDLVELAVAKLAKGGRVLFETVNPESVYAMKWFWMDLSHVRPVPAPSLARLMSASGLKDVTVDYRSPVPGADALPPEAAGDPRFAAVQRLLFAPQDYAVTGVK